MDERSIKVSSEVSISRTSCDEKKQLLHVTQRSPAPTYCSKDRSPSKGTSLKDSECQRGAIGI
eukprot:c9881_g1_i1 orf=45-233(-)